MTPIPYVGYSYKDRAWICSNHCDNTKCKYHPDYKEEPTNDETENA